MPCHHFYKIVLTLCRRREATCMVCSAQSCHDTSAALHDKTMERNKNHIAGFFYIFFFANMLLQSRQRYVWWHPGSCQILLRPPPPPPPCGHSTRPLRASCTGHVQKTSRQAVEVYQHCQRLSGSLRPYRIAKWLRHTGILIKEP